MPLPRPVVSLLGPALVVVASLVVERAALFGPRFPTVHDLLVEWFPNLCFLSRSISSGHVPGWNPHVMGGIPFAADSLHGWMNAPAMAVFGTTSCTIGLRWYLVVLPILAGLGILWFLRSEGVGRPGATIGGLVLALGLAGSRHLAQPWLAAYTAWTAILLATLSRYLRVSTWPSRLLWLAAAAVAWGQLAAAHFSNGVMIGTAAAVAYVVARIAGDAASGRRGLAASARLAALLLVACVAVNLGFLLPVLTQLTQTTVGQGYARMRLLSVQLSHGVSDGGVFSVTAVSSTWPLAFALSPGLYLGAVPLALSFAGWWDRPRRATWVGLAAFGAVMYALSLDIVVRNVAPHLEASRWGSLYLHAPHRFEDGLPIALAALAGLGVQAWIDRPALAARVAMLVPGVIVWGVLPVVMGAGHAFLLLLVIGGGLGLLGLAGVAVRPALAAVLPVLVAAELVANGLLGVTSFGRSRADQRAPLGPLVMPFVGNLDLTAYATPGPIARALEANPGARYLSVGKYAVLPSPFRTPSFWPLMTLQRSMILGGEGPRGPTLEEAQGYNSVQLLRYWEFVRKVGPKVLNYQGSFFVDPPAVALDLLQVDWLVADRARPPVPGATPVAIEESWALWRLPRAVPRASVLTAWRVVSSRDEALNAVASPSFDPSAELVLERGPDVPGPSPGGRSATGTAAYRSTGAQSARITVHAPRPAVVLVRQSYDPNWHATVDGRAAPVLPADFVDQGIPVPAGDHTVALWYDDPWIGRGLAASAVSLALLLGGAAALWRRRTRSGPGREPE